MEASKNDRLVKKFAALEDKTWFPQELLELVKDVCRLQGEVRASLAVSVDPALVCGDMEHRQGAPLLAREQFPSMRRGPRSFSALSWKWRNPCRSSARLRSLSGIS